MEKARTLHQQFLKSPLTRQKAQAAIRSLGHARADQVACDSEQRRLSREVNRVAKAKQRAREREQEALKNIVLGFGLVPVEIEGEQYDICSLGEKLYTVRRQ